jgi:hypothetical protein
LSAALVNKRLDYMRPRSPDLVCTINFQTTEKVRDDLHELAKQQDRSASSLIRAAVNALLAGQPPNRQEPAAPA